MKKFFLCSVIFFAATLSLSAARDGQPITVNQLPTAAQKFLTTYFKDKTPAYVSKEKKLLGAEYEVYYVDRIKVEFDSSGEWTEVECKHTIVPEGLIPAAIKTFVATHYPQIGTKKIERSKRDWEVELTNGIELKFDKSFNLIDIDD